MPNTRGGLEPATIVNLSTNAEVYCMFNPHEYTVAKQNQWTNDEVKGKNVPKVKFSQGGAQTMSLTLVFDTYAEETDVRTHTEELWNMKIPACKAKHGIDPLRIKGQCVFQFGFDQFFLIYRVHYPFF